MKCIYKHHFCKLQISEEDAWDLTLNTPWEVSKKLRGEKLFNVGILPPIPGNKTELNKTGFAGLDDTTSDAFKSAGIALRSSSDTRLWQERLSWERKAAYKKWTSLIAKQFGSWEICRQLWAGNSLGMAQGGLLESVMDALGNKATSTIHARVGLQLFPIDGTFGIRVHEEQSS